MLGVNADIMAFSRLSLSPCINACSCAKRQPPGAGKGHAPAGSPAIRASPPLGQLAPDLAGVFDLRGQALTGFAK